jgi:hypothetical protein
MFDSSKIILAAIALIAVLLSFMTGQTAGEKAQKQVNEQIMTEKLSALTSERDSLRAETQNYQREYTEAKATVTALRDKLKTQVTSRQTDEADLRLYRRIADMDDAEQKGLHIHKVTMSKNFDTNEVALNVRLVQSQGRNRVTGSVSARLIPDAGKPIKISGVDSQDAPEFNLRFFETVYLRLPQETGDVDEVEITVTPKNKQHEPFTELIPWAEIERVR